MSADYELATQQFVRALRGARSQRQLSRRLGYRSNPVAEWEQGRRAPYADVVFAAFPRLNLDLGAALERFHEPSADALSIPDAEHVSAWLRALRGTTPISLIAKRSGLSRFSVSRVLSGQSRPRLPIFFQIFDAITGRLSDLVAELVPIEQVPVLQQVHSQRRLRRSLAFSAPWSEAIIRLLETRGYRETDASNEDWLLARLKMPKKQLSKTLALMRESGALQMSEGKLIAGPPDTVYTQGTKEESWNLRRHWLETVRSYAEDADERDLFSYNTISVAEQDLDAIREILRAAFREVRAVVAASEPVEKAAVMAIQLVELRDRSEKAP